MHNLKKYEEEALAHADKKGELEVEREEKIELKRCVEEMEINNSQKDIKIQELERKIQVDEERENNRIIKEINKKALSGEVFWRLEY